LWQEVMELHRQRPTLPRETFAQRRAALEAIWDQLLARELDRARGRVAYLPLQSQTALIHWAACS
jgi:hypothetical protein